MAQLQTNLDMAVYLDGGLLMREMYSSQSPEATLVELQTSPAQVGESVDKTAITQALHKYNLYDRMARRTSLLKEIKIKSHLQFATSQSKGHGKHVEDGAMVRWDWN